MSAGSSIGTVSVTHHGRATVLALIILSAVAGLYAAWDRCETRREMLLADPDAIPASPRLLEAALADGAAVFQSRCSVCHGHGGEGNTADGVPELRDQDWLYGSGRISEIESVIRYGIRSGNRKGWNLASMPAYASVRPYAAEPIPPLSPHEVDDVVQLLRAFEGQPADDAAIARGRLVYAKGGCWDCHGADARGDSAIGAPNLRDDITLFGGSAAALTRTVERGRRGVSPAFAGTLDAEQIRAASVYVASLSHAAAPTVQRVSP